MPGKVKRCANCGAEKPIADFRKVTANKDGRAYSCKPCIKAKAKAAYAARTSDTRTPGPGGIKPALTPGEVGITGPALAGGRSEVGMAELQAALSEVRDFVARIQPILEPLGLMVVVKKRGVKQ